MAILTKHTLHIFLKFQQGSFENRELDINTIQEHRTILELEGRVWWGNGRHFAIEIAEHFRKQIEHGETTKVYMYEVETHNWYLAKLLDICENLPADRHLIPGYYRDSPQPSYLKLADLKALSLQMKARRIQNPLVYVYEENGEGPEYVRVASSGLGILLNAEQVEWNGANLAPVDLEAEPPPWVSLTAEKDLENYLAAHPEVLEQGLSLVKQQYETGVGKIDLLLRDKNDILVVVETKRGRESDKVVGQILRYMGWIRVEEEKSVRGIIVINEPNARLEYAVTAVPGLRIVTYKVRFEFVTHKSLGYKLHNIDREADECEGQIVEGSS